jgi:FAD/FMN-containing dehydrogenase
MSQGCKDRGVPESLARLETDLAEIVGPAHALTDPGTRAPYETDWTRRFTGPALMVVRPGSTGEVARVVGVCSAAGVPIVTQGGNTGLVGGGVPGTDADAPVVLSTTRLSWIDPPDAVAAQVTAGAGATLARLQAAASGVGLSFPVDLAARDSATVGGLVATNAGGLHVLRYGSTRAQVIGLEVVLADGSVVSRLGGLVKDNTGYDLSQLMVGSEGTLGIVTAARLRLVPAQNERVVALLGLESMDEALSVLEVLRRRAEGLQAAEVFFEDGLDLVAAYSGAGDPLPRRWPVYLLVECAGVRDVSGWLFEALTALDLDEAATAVADDPAGTERLWSYRERHTEAISSVGIPHKLDVTLPLGRLGEFVAAVRETVEKASPGARLVLFGHIGDGNLHVNVVGPDPEDEAVDEAVLKLVAALGGSISAEHGVGRAKARWLHLSRSPAEMAAMRAVKAALDPEGILNPGVLFA